MGELPVEDGAQSVGPDEQVAHPEVAVDGDVRSVGAGGRSSHRTPELERRSGLAEAVQERERVVERVTAWQPGDPFGPDAVDAGQRGSALRGQLGRAAAQASSRSSRRGMVSPSRRSTTSQPGSSPSAVPAATTPGTGTPASSGRPEQRRLDPGPLAGRHPGPRSCWRMSGRTAPSPPTRSNELVMRDAPPDSRRQAAHRPAEDPAELVGRIGGPAAPTTRGRRRASRRRRADGGTRRCRTRTGPHRRRGASTGSAPR